MQQPYMRSVEGDAHFFAVSYAGAMQAYVEDIEDDAVLSAE